MVGACLPAFTWKEKRMWGNISKSNREHKTRIDTSQGWTQDRAIILSSAILVDVRKPSKKCYKVHRAYFHCNLRQYCFAHLWWNNQSLIFSIHIISQIITTLFCKSRSARDVQPTGDPPRQDMYHLFVILADYTRSYHRRGTVYSLYEIWVLKFHSCDSCPTFQARIFYVNY